MTGRDSWRSLQGVMVVMLHVEAVAYVISRLVRPVTLLDSVVWLPVTIGVALFLSWPIGRAVSAIFEPRDPQTDLTCPKCRRRDLRPLVRHGAGLFQPISGYRCAACWSTFRPSDASTLTLERETPPETGPVDPSGIEFLDDAVHDEGEIQFLDERTKSGA